MPSPADPARRGNRLTTLYVAIWGVMAVGALAYLIMTFAVRPGALSQVAGGLSPVVTGSIDTPATSAEPSELEQVKQSLTAVQSDVQGIKEVLGRQDGRDREVTALRADVTELSNSFAMREDRDRALSSRLAAVEARQATTDNVAAAYRSPVQPQTAKESVVISPTITGSVDDPGRRATQAEARSEPKAAKSQTTQTAAATSAIPAFGAPKVVNAQPKAETISGPVGLQLMSADSPDALRLSWLKLSSGNGDIFQDLDVRYRQIPTAKGNVYRLIAGPVADAAEGARLCAQLKARKLGCSIAAFAGEPL
ncbi:MAG: SPOR domain-containing protein [Hyphomicrobiaceae bacterium]